MWLRNGVVIKTQCFSCKLLLRHKDVSRGGVNATKYKFVHVVDLTENSSFGLLSTCLLTERSRDWFEVGAEIFIWRWCALEMLTLRSVTVCGTNKFKHLFDWIWEAFQWYGTLLDVAIQHTVIINKLCSEQFYLSTKWLVHASYEKKKMHAVGLIWTSSHRVL